MEHVIRYYKGPAFTASEWSTRNPTLERGEVGYVITSGIVTAAKVGPGKWNDLGYLGDDVYNYTDTVTNPIGDAFGVLQGQKLSAVIYKMLNPYVPPAFSNVQNNASGSFANDIIREIGQSVNGPVIVTYNISHSDKLLGATPINVSAGGTFSNEGAKAHTGNISLSLAAPLTPAAVTTKIITLTATHTNGTTSGSNTYIRFYPKIIWFSSALNSILSGATLMAQINKQNVISNDFTRDYTFTSGGYSWLCIPSMLSPTSLTFTDVTDPNAPAGYGMTAMGTISVNNGVGTYNYTLYRSTFLLINPTKLRVS